MANGDILKVVVTNIGRVEDPADIGLLEFDVTYSIENNAVPGVYSTDYPLIGTSTVGMTTFFGEDNEDRYALVS